MFAPDTCILRSPEICIKYALIRNLTRSFDWFIASGSPVNVTK